MAEILHTAVGPQAVDKPSTVAVFGQSLDFDAHRPLWIILISQPQKNAILQLTMCWGSRL